MDMAGCMVERSVKLDTVDNTSMDHARGADLDAIDVERILERACYGARRRLPLYQGRSLGLLAGVTVGGGDSDRGAERPANFVAVSPGHST